MAEPAATPPIQRLGPHLLGQNAFDRATLPFHGLLPQETRAEQPRFLPGRPLQDLETSSPANYPGSQRGFAHPSSPGTFLQSLSQCSPTGALKRPLEDWALAEGGKSARYVPTPLHHSWMSGHF